MNHLNIKNTGITMKKHLSKLFILFSFTYNFIYASSGNLSKDAVMQLVSSLKAEAQKQSPNFNPILEKYLDWHQIAQNVLISARRPLRDGDAQKKVMFKDFLPTFQETFKKKVITDYAKADYLNKFSHTTFDFDNAKIENKGRIVIVKTTAKLENSEAVWNINWTINPKTNRVIEIQFDNIKIFASQTSQITAAFNAGYGNGDYQNGLNSVSALFNGNH
jgi:hypothetical protein